MTEIAVGEKEAGAEGRLRASTRSGGDGNANCPLWGNPCVITEK